MFITSKSIFLLFSNILEILDRAEPTRFFHIPVENPRDVSQISGLLQMHKDCYQKATQTILANEHPLKVARKIQEHIQSAQTPQR